jgi:hypothetical protein
MARARNIKPGFFKNEELAECSLAARLCFAGLWTLADREGRLEDRPKRIKGELFPFDTFEVEPLLQELARQGFILRYEVDGQRCIQISKFTAHQTPHFTEKDSVIKPPALPESGGDDPPPGSKNTPGVDGSSRGGRYPLNPDSLNPDSPNHEKAMSNDIARRQAGDQTPQLSLVEPPKPKPKGPPDCPHLAVLALWAEVLPAMPQHDAERWRGTKADHLRTRWRETAVAKEWADAAQGLAYLRKLFVYVGQSRFLTGRVTPREQGKPPFTVTLAWLVKPANWDKTIEGTYHQDAA